MSRNRWACLLMTGCATTALWVGPGYAQSISKKKPTAKRPIGTEEITVTAQRRSQRLVAVPASITVISGRQLARSGVKSALDLGQISVGTEVQRQGGFVQPAIRGISTLTTGLGFENNVALYIDGFYQPDTVSLSSGLGSISDIEILKGPQGTLYGRNATGGAILINTPDPSRIWNGNVQASYARFNDHIVQGYLSGPIGNGDLATFNIAAYNRYSDGYIRNTLGQDGYASPLASTNVRTKLKLTPTDNITITLGYAHTYLNDPFGLVFMYPNYSPFPDNLHATKPNTATNNEPSEDSVTVDSFTNKTVVDTSIGVLTSHTGYDRRSTHDQYDYDGSLVPVINTYNGQATQNTFQQGLDFQVTVIPHLDLLVGTSYYYDHTLIPDSLTVINGVPLASNTSKLSSSAGAAYTSATYHLGSFSLTGGVRGNIERRTLSYFQTPSPGFPAVEPGRAGKTFAGATPNVSLAYALSPHTNVYASYSTGYRSGQFQPTVVPEPSLITYAKPERINALEVGVKTSQSIWTMNAALFYYDFRDLQVGIVVPSPASAGGGLIETLLNASHATSYGAEVEGTVRPLAGWSINGGVAVLHARYSSFDNAIGNGLDAATSLDVTSQPQNWSGLHMSRAPAVTANLGTFYSFGLARGQMTVAANASFTSSFIPNDPSTFGPLAGPGLAGTQRYMVGAYALLNADISWTDPSGHYSIAIFATNITNSHYLSVYNGSSFGDEESYGQPAQYGIRLGYKF